jgi:hypothetical protein
MSVDENANAHENLLNHNIGHPTKTMVFFPFSFFLYNLERKLTMYLPTWDGNYPCNFPLGVETTHVSFHLDEKLPLYLPPWLGNYPYTFPLLHF